MAVQPMFESKPKVETRPLIEAGQLTSLRSLLTTAVVLCILLVGLALRLYRVNYQSAWENEAFSLNVSHLPFPEMKAKLVEDFVHPPLHYYLLHEVFREFGFGDYPARLVSAIFGTLTILAIFLLAQYLFDTSTGLIAAVLMAISQLAIMYSQEARPYSMAVCLTAFAIYFFCVALRERNWLAWCGFVVFSILMLYTHYYAGMILACLYVYGFFRRKQFRIPALWWSLALLALAAAFVPWLTSGVVEKALGSPKVTRVNQAPWYTAHWTAFFQDLNRFNNGYIRGLLDSSPWWCFIVAGLLFSLPVLLALKPRVSPGGTLGAKSLDRENSVLLAILWLAPHVTLVGLGLMGMQYDVRYVLFCIVPYYVLVARGIMTMPVPAWRIAWVAGIALFSGFALRANYFIPYKEDYRAALLHVAKAQQPGDCVLFYPVGILPRAWSVYQVGWTLPRIIGLQASDLRAESCERVWLVKYERMGVKKDELRRLEQKLQPSFIRSEEQQYFWIGTTLFERKQLSSKVVTPDAPLTDDLK
jgi:mannosyltransferase